MTGSAPRFLSPLFSFATLHSIGHDLSQAPLPQPSELQYSVAGFEGAQSLSRRDRNFFIINFIMFLKKAELGLISLLASLFCKWVLFRQILISGISVCSSYLFRSSRNQKIAQNHKKKIDTFIFVFRFLSRFK